MVKITDVADLAGVSVSTVSRILRKDTSFSAAEETVVKVRKAAAELGYKPLRVHKKKSNNLDFKKSITILTAVTKEDEEHDPYWSEIRSKVEQEANKKGYKVEEVIRLDHNLNLEMMDDSDGYIVLGVSNPESLLEYGLDPLNTIIVDNSLIDSKGFDKVTSNLYEATLRIIEKLDQCGHKDIALIGGVELVKDIQDKSFTVMDDVRTVAYKERMSILNRFDEASLEVGDWTTSSGYELARKILEQKNFPTAIIVASDPLAIGVLHAIKEKGLKVPEDISIISYDNNEASAFMDPPLTTVDLFNEELGTQAVNLLIQRLEGRKTPIKVTVQSELIERKSVMNLNK